jgi:polysaccharide biosynthesis protein PelA
MYKYWFVAAILIACSVMFSESIFATFQAKTPLNRVSDYKIYYGEANDQIVEKLGNYDLAIIEPHEFTKEQIKRINELDTITLGYISVMELENWNEGFVEKVQESDFYYSNNKKVYIEKWDTYFMDISNSHYRQIILEEIQEEILSKGLDGIFLDTTGDIDDFFLKKPKELQKLRNGYVTLLKDIKKQNKQLILLQNWGFDTYKNASNPFIDGILWEDFSKSRNQHDKWSQSWIKYFNAEEKKGKLAVFTVSPNSLGKSYSEKIGFVSYKNENSIYNDWFE